MAGMKKSYGMEMGMSSYKKGSGYKKGMAYGKKKSMPTAHKGISGPAAGKSIGSYKKSSYKGMDY